MPILCRFAEYAERHGAASLLSAASLIEAFAELRARLVRVRDNEPRQEVFRIPQKIAYDNGTQWEPFDYTLGGHPKPASDGHLKTGQL